MEVRILMKNGDKKTYNGIVKVTNASTKLERDWLFIYQRYDRFGNPSHRIPMNEVLCVEVKENRYD